jgi:hypothetical protein
MKPAAVVFNRVRSLALEDNGQWAERARRAAQAAMARYPQHAPAIDALVENAADLATMAEADAAAIAQFLQRTDPRQPAYRVPAFMADVHDLKTLVDLGAHLM